MNGKDKVLQYPIGTTEPHSNRRAKLLKDLQQAIQSERSQGFRPILMMDANEDWTAKDRKDLQEFMIASGLVDPLVGLSTPPSNIPVTAAEFCVHGG